MFKVFLKSGPSFLKSGPRWKKSGKMGENACPNPRNSLLLGSSVDIWRRYNYDLTHSLIHHFETIPNSKKLQTTFGM